MPLARTQRLATLAEQSGKFHEPILLRLAGVFGVFAGKIAVVLRLHFATVVFLHVSSLQNPIATQRRQALIGGARERRIAPWPAAIIDAHGLIRRDRAGVRLRRCDFDLPHRHANVLMQRALNVNLFARRQLFAAVRFERIFGRDHNLHTKSRESGSILAPALSGSSYGSSALARRTLSVTAGDRDDLAPRVTATMRREDREVKVGRGPDGACKNENLFPTAKEVPESQAGQQGQCPC